MVEKTPGEEGTKSKNFNFQFNIFKFIFMKKIERDNKKKEEVVNESGINTKFVASALWVRAVCIPPSM